MNLLQMQSRYRRLTKKLTMQRNSKVKAMDLLQMQARHVRLQQKRK